MQVGPKVLSLQSSLVLHPQAGAPATVMHLLPRGRPALQSVSAAQATHFPDLVSHTGDAGSLQSALDVQGALHTPTPNSLPRQRVLPAQSVSLMHPHIFAVGWHRCPLARSLQSPWPAQAHTPLASTQIGPSAPGFCLQCPSLSHSTQAPFLFWVHRCCPCLVHWARQAAVLTGPSPVPRSAAGGSSSSLQPVWLRQAMSRRESRAFIPSIVIDPRADRSCSWMGLRGRDGRGRVMIRRPPPAAGSTLLAVLGEAGVAGALLGRGAVAVRGATAGLDRGQALLAVDVVLAVGVRLADAQAAGAVVAQG